MKREEEEEEEQAKIRPVVCQLLRSDCSFGVVAPFILDLALCTTILHQISTATPVLIA
eukprot:m.38805 g.38805  ORF g.38805 m.38805 type:complete len:58 (+) comp18017_c0_seq2:79-252(+)